MKKAFQYTLITVNAVGIVFSSINIANAILAGILALYGISAIFSHWPQLKYRNINRIKDKEDRDISIKIILWNERKTPITIYDHELVYYDDIVPNDIKTIIAKVTPTTYSDTELKVTADIPVHIPFTIEPSEGIGLYLEPWGARYLDNGKLSILGQHINATSSTKNTSTKEEITRNVIFRVFASHKKRPFDIKLDNDKIHNVAKNISDFI
ncbi:hypothetical protein ACFLZV_02670 [Candidatus Margulisiibacteriota bacterium]